MMHGDTVIVWFRQDLRLHDNEALDDAVNTGKEIIPVYVFDDRVFRGETMFGFPKTGIHRLQFIRESVADLRTSLRALGSDLVVRHGLPEEEIFKIAHAVKSRWVFCNRERTRDEVAVQDALEKNLWSIGQEVRFSRGKMLFYTADLPFPVTHTPDHYATFRKETERFVKVRHPLPAPECLPPVTVDIPRGEIPSLSHLVGGKADLLPNDISGGETAALRQLDALKSNPGASYDGDFISLAGDSKPRLSPWLAQGCLSPKLAYHSLRECSLSGEAFQVVAQRLMLRDYMRLMVKKHGNRVFLSGGITGQAQGVSGKEMETFRIWARGHTGLPIIDAAMQQLNKTGFMPHRARVLCAQFLVRELGVAWRPGASYFESMLIDYDPCSNWVNWNQVAGVGPEQREERRLNYILQARRLDPDGEYVRTWIPALRRAATEWVHQPDQASSDRLQRSQIRLGKDYPHALVSTDRWHILN